MTRAAVLIAGIATLITTALVPSALARDTTARSTSVGPVHFCPAPTAGHASCLAERLAVASPSVARGGQPKGLGARDIRSAYHLSATAGRGRTVAVVVAYDDPSAAADLAAYRAKYGLARCTIGNGCFRKVNQAGGRAMPRVDAAWAGEASLDIEMVSAACASCKILLVEARSSAMADLATAVDYAATQHVFAISNSYGSGDSRYSAAYNHPGIAVVAAAGDSGYGAGAPAKFSTVIAVGGTSLTRSKNARGWTERAWSGGGSMCAAGTAKPAWQTAVTQCRGKAVSDVSAVADPNTGVAAYLGTTAGGRRGWQVTGGTSAAAPIIAGVYAMSTRAARYPAAYTWSHRSGLNDVTGGRNGRCATDVWCRARTGWDGPSGLGTPDGTSSF